MPFTIIRQDITKMNVDAIVNAANTDLRMGGGVCGAIFDAAGPRELQEACNKVAPIKTGEAAITPGFKLPAKFVIHAAGPIYHNWSPTQSEKYLGEAYRNSLMLAQENGCESIAFPLISSGIYGYPKDEALRVATEAVTDYLATHEDMEVYLAVFDKSAFAASRKLLGEVESYIDQNYVDSHPDKRRDVYENFFARNVLDKRNSTVFASAIKEAGEEVMAEEAAEAAKKTAENACEDGGIESLIDDLDEPFADTLLKIIDKKGKTDVEVYKKANIDRKLFSKIRSIKGYTPKKQTILALAIALELSLDETDDLLERAGYALSHAVKFDVIIEYFIINKKYDIFEINEVLFQYDQPLLGA